VNEWHLDRLPEEVRREAEDAAHRAGLPLHRWLSRVIRDICAEEGIGASRDLPRINIDTVPAQNVIRTAPAMPGDIADPAAPSPETYRALTPLPPRPPARPANAPGNGIGAAFVAYPPSHPAHAPRPQIDIRNYWPKDQPPPAPHMPPPRTDERQAALARLVAGLQQNELSPIGEARFYLKLLTEHMASIGDITVATGKTRDQVARTLRLLGLSDRLRDMIDRGVLSRDQAFALLDAADPEAFASVILPAAVARRMP